MRFLAILALLSVHANCDKPKADGPPKKEGNRDTPEKVTRLVFEALKSGNNDKFEPLLIRKTELEWWITQFKAHGTPEEFQKSKKTIDDLGGVDGFAKKQRIQQRNWFTTARKEAASAFDWSKAQFGGIIRLRNHETKNGIEAADIYFRVRVGGTPYRFKFNNCFKGPNGWVSSSDVRFLGKETD